MKKCGQLTNFQIKSVNDYKVVIHVAETVKLSLGARRRWNYTAKALRSRSREVEEDYRVAVILELGG